MLFNSNIFLFVFLPVAIAGYYLSAHYFGSAMAKVWLCVASFIFYGWWNPVFLVLLVGSIAFNYALSVFLKETEQESSRSQTALLVFGVAANLLLLFFYKYLFPLLGFLHDLGWTEIDYGSIMLPIGISFFTFTQIGYLIDCREGIVRERGLLNYVLFVTFFPHLIAGPILHNREIMPQFADRETFRFKTENLASGLTLFALGLAKKVLLADSIAPWAESGFANVAGLPLFHAWSVAIAYSMQLYFDFSGYSDMAIGLGIMFGVKLPLNFNSPYKSSSIIEFWQRWHMTLTRYLTLLLYNPMSLAIARRRQARGLPSGKQVAITPRSFAINVVYPTMTTMFLAGLWHGAGLQYIVYGVLHGTYLSVNHAWRMFRAKRPRSTEAQAAVWVRIWSNVWPVALTFLAVLVAQIFFRANSTADAMQLLAGMIGMNGTGLPLTIPINNVQYLGVLKEPLLNANIFVVGLREVYNSATLPLITNSMLGIGLMIIVFATPNVYQIMGPSSPALNKVKPSSWTWPSWKPSVGWAVTVAILLYVSSIYFYRAARFLYFQF